jgi:hypothetical protein
LFKTFASILSCHFRHLYVNSFVIFGIFASFSAFLGQFSPNYLSSSLAFLRILSCVNCHNFYVTSSASFGVILRHFLLIFHHLASFCVIFASFFIILRHFASFDVNWRHFSLFCVILRQYFQIQ